LLEKLSADIWFLFGSFAYGFEGRVVACQGDSLELEIASPETESAHGVGLFLEDLVTNGRGLVKSQLTLFCEDNSLELGEACEVCLFTDILPTARANAPLGLILFSGVRGVTPRDSAMWQKLVAESRAPSFELR
jgi:hypothetical protein